MTLGVVELYDYDELRRVTDATMLFVGVAAPTLVLGGRQSADALNLGGVTLPLRRRRGGGGIVLVQPGDLWVDWWIPGGDPRWRADVRASSLVVGRWWQEVLGRHVAGEVSVHDGPLEGALEHRVACFAGLGPGEVLVDGRKAVGLTQWRVREGSLLSTVLPAHGSSALVSLLRDEPAELAPALEHHTTSTLGVVDPSRLVGELGALSGPWLERCLVLSAHPIGATQGADDFGADVREMW